MKVALAYDYLNQLGGGERVLRVLADMFPAAPIYTILYDPERTGNIFSDRRVVTSVLDFVWVRQNHRWFIPLMPCAIQSLNLRDDFDLVISAGAGYGKGIGYGFGTKHIHYCYTPLRYAWESEHLENFQFPIPNSQLRNVILKPMLSYLRKWDYQMAQRPDVILADSNFIAAKIEKYYNRQAVVLYPPLDEKKLFLDPKIKKSDYFLAVGRLVHYKRFDLIINVFNQLRLPLKIVGIGPEWSNLKSIINSPKIELVGFVPDERLRQLYAEARALIFPQEEDFGLVAIEAQACGTPIIALARGGAVETVEDGKTGIFFSDQSGAGLMAALNQFVHIEDNFDQDYIAKRARRFSLQNFKNVINSTVLSLC